MNTQSMIERAAKLAESIPGYSYNRAELERLIKEGLFALPVGEPIVRRGDQYLVYTGAEVICHKVVNGQAIETRRTPASEAAIEALIIQNAVDVSKASTAGTIA